MIVIDREGQVRLFNKSAERIIGYKKEEAIGKYILEVIPTSKLLRIIRTKQIEVNYELTLENGKENYYNAYTDIKRGRRGTRGICNF
ncbi:PAS domain S-box protein [Bacillus cereus]